MKTVTEKVFYDKNILCHSHHDAISAGVISNSVSWPSTCLLKQVKTVPVM